MYQSFHLNSSFELFFVELTIILSHSNGLGSLYLHHCVYPSMIFYLKNYRSAIVDGTGIVKHKTIAIPTSGKCINIYIK